MIITQFTIKNAIIKQFVIINFSVLGYQQKCFEKYQKLPDLFQKLICTNSQNKFLQIVIIFTGIKPLRFCKSVQLSHC